MKPHRVQGVVVDDQTRSTTQDDVRTLPAEITRGHDAPHVPVPLKEVAEQLIADDQGPRLAQSIAASVPAAVFSSTESLSMHQPQLHDGGANLPDNVHLDHVLECTAYPPQHWRSRQVYPSSAPFVGRHIIRKANSQTFESRCTHRDQVRGAAARSQFGKSCKRTTSAPRSSCRTHAWLTIHHQRNTLRGKNADDGDIPFRQEMNDRDAQHWALIPLGRDRFFRVSLTTVDRDVESLQHR